MAEAEADFLDLLCEATVEPARWTAVLQRFADLVGGNFASLVVQDQVTGNGRSIEAHHDPERHPLYFEHFGSRNPLLRITDAPARPRVMVAEEKVPRDELMRTEFYNDFMRRFDMHSLLIARLAVGQRNTTVVNVARSARREPFGEREIESANRLLPHLVRAVHLSERFAALRELSCGLGEAIERSPHAAFLATADGKVFYGNRAGEILAGGKDGVTLRNGFLAAATEPLTRKLQGLIAAAGARNGERRSGAMALARPDRRRPLSAIVSPIRSEQLAIFCEGPSVLVSIRDPEVAVATSGQTVRDLFGLSRAESRVALQLLKGDSPRQAAEALGVSFYTVRAHLARIFDKTGTNRQSELVGLLMRAVGVSCE